MSGMWRVVLTDEELHALHGLLTEATRPPTKFRLSPALDAYRSVLRKIAAAEEASAPARR
jgi:hypothetical protein